MRNLVEGHKLALCARWNTVVRGRKGNERTKEANRKKKSPGPTDDNKQELEKGIMSLQKRSRVCCFSGRIALFAWIQNKSTSLHGDRPTIRAKGRSGVSKMKGTEYLEYLE